MARTEYFKRDKEMEELTETVPCKDNAFLDLTVEPRLNNLERIKNGKCLDPAITTTEGNGIFGIRRKPGFKF